jgi:hypothetical protein
MYGARRLSSYEMPSSFGPGVKNVRNQGTLRPCCLPLPNFPQIAPHIAYAGDAVCGEERKRTRAYLGRVTSFLVFLQTTKASRA